jgi:uncharacterized membrane protein YgcG
MKHNPIITMFFVIALAALALPCAVTQAQTQPAAREAWAANQLDNLVAPIALYPDPVLSQMLAASTYPLEIVEANRWLQRNRNLDSRALVNAAKQQPWDPSVQALVAIPDALAKLDEDIRWTTDLGDAFLAQQPDVMNAVQRMRARAQADGRLSSTPQQTVITQDQVGPQTIIIEPANPDVVYIPEYDPVYIWGPPIYGYYPPLVYPAFGFGFGSGFDLSFCFGDWGGWGFWGWGPNWLGRSVIVDNRFFSHYGFYRRSGEYFGRTAWAHDPDHRLNVPYGNTHVAARYGGSAAFPFSNDFRYARQSPDQGYRNGSRQVQRSQNPPRQQYQDRAMPRQNRSTPQVQRSQNQEQQRYQGGQQFRATPQPYRAPQVQRFSAPRASSPKLSGGGGGFSRNGYGGSFSRGGGGSGGRGRR